MTIRSHSLWAWTMGVVIAAPLFYVLSYGPAMVWIENRDPYWTLYTPKTDTEILYEQFYYPVQWGCERSKTFEHAMRWYYNLLDDCWIKRPASSATYRTRKGVI